MFKKSYKIKSIFLFYWILLLYILSALIWWYIALNRQNNQMTAYEIAILKKDSTFSKSYQTLIQENRRKKTQFIGEGSIFLLIITVGAVFLFRAVNKQLKLSQQQQHFMMAITHELKTPIAITKLNLETLQKRKLEDIQQQRLIGNSIEENNRMNDLCSNLLLSSQMEGNGYQIIFEKLNFSSLVENCVSDFKNRYPQKCIEFSDLKDIYTIGDAFLLKIAINNLIDNSIKYAPKESSVMIALNNNNNLIELHIADNGPGIPDKDKKNVFKKFYRTGPDATKKSKGTGLGLFLVDRIIKLHKGSVTIKDNEPLGADFVIQLNQTDKA